MSNKRIFKKAPPRLERIFQRYDPPLYFVTFGTWRRKRILASQPIHEAFVEYAQMNVSQGRAVGRFVIMPDHIHLFVRIEGGSCISDFVRLLKQHLGKELKRQGVSRPWWQPGFFDRLLRHSESYVEKWRYVYVNPVRAGLVRDPDAWPYQGEIERIDRV